MKALFMKINHMESFVTVKRLKKPFDVIRQRPYFWTRFKTQLWGLRPATPARRQSLICVMKQWCSPLESTGALQVAVPGEWALGIAPLQPYTESATRTKTNEAHSTVEEPEGTHGLDNNQRFSPHQPPWVPLSAYKYPPHCHTCNRQDSAHLGGLLPHQLTFRTESAGWIKRHSVGKTCLKKGREGRRGD